MKVWLLVLVSFLVACGPPFELDAAHVGNEGGLQSVKPPTSSDDGGTDAGDLPEADSVDVQSPSQEASSQEASSDDAAPDAVPAPDSASCVGSVAYGGVAYSVPTDFVYHTTEDSPGASPSQCLECGTYSCDCIAKHYTGCGPCLCNPDGTSRAYSCTMIDGLAVFTCH